MKAKGLYNDFPPLLIIYQSMGEYLAEQRFVTQQIAFFFFFLNLFVKHKAIHLLGTAARQTTLSSQWCSIVLWKFFLFGIFQPAL